MVASVKERVVRRYAAEVRARGLLRPGPQAQQLKRVLQDLDRANYLRDFDILGDVIASLDKAPLPLPPDRLREARGLAHRMHAIHKYITTFVLDAVVEAGELLEVLEDQARHPEDYMGIAASSGGA